MVFAKQSYPFRISRVKRHLVEYRDDDLNPSTSPSIFSPHPTLSDKLLGPSS